MRINAKAIPIKNNSYSCHITAVELVKPIVLGPYHATSYKEPWAQTHILTIHT